VGERVGELGMEGFMEKISFEPGVTEKRNEGW